MFQKATRQQSKLRLCVSGPSGSGKTTGALILANEIKVDGRIAVIDTENGSASLYADDFDFDVLNMQPPYQPNFFVEAIKGAEQAGYSVIVIDSASHEWEGSGGCLDMNEHTARTKFKGNTWSAWSDTNKEHQKFINAIVHSSAHVICTTRSKTETAQEGKRIMRLGTKLAQRDNFEYEFTVALDLIHDGHFATAIKDRTKIFANSGEQPITPETGQALMNWLNAGQSADQLIEEYISDINACTDEETMLALARTAFTAMRAYGDEYTSRIVEAKDSKLASINEYEPDQCEESIIMQNEQVSKVS